MSRGVAVTGCIPDGFEITKDYAFKRSSSKWEMRVYKKTKEVKVFSYRPITGNSMKMLADQLKKMEVWLE